jgi:hypothetical protein
VTAFDDIWERTRAAAIESHGKGASSPFGDLPRMLAGEPIVFLGQWSLAVRDAIVNRNQFGEDVPLVGGATLQDAVMGGSTTSVDTYMMRGIPLVNDAVLRQVDDAYYSPLWEPSKDGVGPEASGNVVRKWQACVNVAAGILSTSPITRSCTEVEVKSFWLALEDLATALDIAALHPTLGSWDAYVEGVRRVAKAELGLADDALTKGAELAGQAANHIANTAGKVGASFLEGFFGDAWPIALVGGAVYTAIHFGVI